MAKFPTIEEMAQQVEERVLEECLIDGEPLGELLDSGDLVHVVRCRDCKFLRLTGTVWKCQNRLVMMLCEPNDYCSRGERHDKD